MKPRTISHSLLGIVSLRPMSGYDIQKFVKENLGYFWKESYGQIYPMLKRMAGQGLVESRVERTNGKPDRQIYSLTASGNAELQKWLGEPAVLPSPRNELLLKLFFGRSGKTEDMRRHVEEFRARHESLSQQYTRVETWLHREHGRHPGLPYWLMTLDYGKRNSRMLLEWSTATLRTMDRLTKADNARTKKRTGRKGGEKP